MAATRPDLTPDLSHETALGARVAGVDEAGRGPLAGPVSAAAVVLDPGNLPVGLNDSKTLTAARREALFDEIHARAQVSLAWASVEEIDRLNIRAASLLAMRRAVEQLKSAPDRGRRRAGSSSANSLRIVWNRSTARA